MGFAQGVSAVGDVIETCHEADCVEGLIVKWQRCSTLDDLVTSIPRVDVDTDAVSIRLDKLVGTTADVEEPPAHPREDHVVPAFLQIIYDHLHSYHHPHHMKHGTTYRAKAD